MIISPKTAIEEGWITHPDCSSLADWEDRKFVSPNAIDFTLDKLFSISKNQKFFICETSKEMRGGHPMPSYFSNDKDAWVWDLSPNSVHDGMSSMHVTIPEGVMCELVVRSTLNRNGIFITSGIYDQGFSGSIGYALHNRSGVAQIAVGTRVGQILFHQADTSGIIYAGGYNTEEGQHWSETSS